MRRAGGGSGWPEPERWSNSAGPSIWEAGHSDGIEPGVAPAVLQPEHFDDEQPEVVFLPCEPVQRGDAEAQVHLRYTDTEQLALLVYSSLEQLIRALGEQQTWISVPAESVSDLLERTGAETVAYDPPIHHEGEAQQ